MADRLETEWSPEKRRSMAAQLQSLGGVGFFLQIALLIVPILFAVYLLMRSRADPAGLTGMGVRNLISLASALVMLFTTYWFYRYMRLGRRMRDRGDATPQSRVISMLWIGFWAGFAGIVLSMLLLLGSAGRMLFVLLANPQTGMLVAPQLGANPAYSLSAIDAVSLTSNIVNLGAELLVLGLTLWLLFRATWPSASKTEAREAVLAE
jgi:hypothetical protein